ncbi:hypothetical protein SESBI_40961 [Sesbania bispinosa]|nr:hypothetical protein SESBI_40961 [Sesbania bispinosa]
MADEGSVAGGEALVDVSGASNEASNSFPWVESAMLSRTSVLLSPESLIPFRNLVRSRFSEVSRFLILEPPAGNEYICLGPSSPSSPAFTFLIFSYYFQAKLGNRPVGWTSLNGFSGRPLLNVIHSSYKDFKPHYFRMRGTEENSELLFNSLGEPKFPLYWTKNPTRLKALKESSLTDLELTDVKLLSSFHVVDCNVLIEKEGDAEALQPYIVDVSSNKEGFVPVMDAKAMKAFSRTNKRKQGSQASGPVLITETEQEVSSSIVSDKLVSKKTCASKGPPSSSIPSFPSPDAVQPVPTGQALLVTLGIPKWWHWFQGFEGQPGTDVTSVFDRRLPTEQLVRSHFCKPNDFVRIQKIGMINTTKMVQVFTTQTAFLGHALETGIGLLEKELKEKTKRLKDEEAEVKKAKEVISELENLRENFKKLSIEKEKVDADLADLKKDKEKFDNLLSEKTKLLEAVEEKLVAEQKGRKEDADHLKAEITFQYEQGFEKVVDQIKFLHPEINVDEVGAFKEVRGGRLVDIPDEE